MPTTLNTARATRTRVKVPNESYGSKVGSHILGSKKVSTHPTSRSLQIYEYKSGRKHPHKLLLRMKKLSSRNVFGDKNHLSPCSDPLTASACTMKKLAWFSMCFLLRKWYSRVNSQCKSMRWCTLSISQPCLECASTSPVCVLAQLVRSTVENLIVNFLNILAYTLL